MSREIRRQEKEEKKIYIYIFLYEFCMYEHTLVY